MLWHKDIQNSALNPYANETVDNLLRLLSDEDTYTYDHLQTYNMAHPDENRDLYPLNLLEMSELNNLDAEKGWYINKTLSPEYTDMVNQGLYTLHNNETGLNINSLKKFYKDQLKNMLNANPYNYDHSSTFTDAADYMFDTLSDEELL